MTPYGKDHRASWASLLMQWVKYHPFVRGEGCWPASTARENSGYLLVVSPSAVLDISQASGGHRSQEVHRWQYVVREVPGKKLPWSTLASEYISVHPSARLYRLCLLYTFPFFSRRFTLILHENVYLQPLACLCVVTADRKHYEDIDSVKIKCRKSIILHSVVTFFFLPYYSNRPPVPSTPWSPRECTIRFSR